MKKIMIAAVVYGFIGTAHAADFNANEYITSFSSGALEFSATSINTSPRDFTTRWNFDQYVNIDSNVFLTYNRFADTLTLGSEFSTVYSVTDQWNINGSMEISYVTPTNSLGNGDFYLRPTVGTSYSFSDRISSFLDVSYSWNASNNWMRQGGEVEVGVNYTFNDHVIITPSVFRTFDTGANATNARIQVAFQF